MTETGADRTARTQTTILCIFRPECENTESPRIFMRGLLGVSGRQGRSLRTDCRIFPIWWSPDGMEKPDHGNKDDGQAAERGNQVAGREKFQSIKQEERFILCSRMVVVIRSRVRRIVAAQDRESGEFAVIAVQQI